MNRNARNTTRKAVTDNGKRKPQSTIQAQERTLEKQTAEAEGKVSVDRRQLDLLSGGGMQTTQRIFDRRSD